MKIKPPFRLLGWRRMANGNWLVRLCNSHGCIAHIDNGLMFDCHFWSDKAAKLWGGKPAKWKP